mmetsp:Transcript_28566/g.31562  ORF Transcript_28566/g.31562 Transcript_28566/m.31562 type:complete len:100 (+) Transcript_28566:281-580(+)
MIAISHRKKLVFYNMDFVALHKSVLLMPTASNVPTTGRNQLDDDQEEGILSRTTTPRSILGCSPKGFKWTSDVKRRVKFCEGEKFQLIPLGMVCHLPTL